MPQRYGSMTPRGKLYQNAGADSAAGALVREAMGGPDISQAPPKKKKKKNKIRDAIIAKLKAAGQKIRGQG